jgi:hypothetical protein
LDRAHSSGEGGLDTICITPWNGPFPAHSRGYDKNIDTLDLPCGIGQFQPIPEGNIKGKTTILIPFSYLLEWAGLHLIPVCNPGDVDYSGTLDLNSDT